MRSTFALTRPPAVAAPFAAAIEALRAATLALDVRSLPLVEARLLCGDFEEVAALLAAATPHPALPLAAALHHDWTGDIHALTGVLPGIRASLELVGDVPEIRAATWTALQRAATDAGDAALAARLVRLARAQPPAAAATREGPEHHVLATARRLFEPGPDAFRGRITLRPRLDGHDVLEVRDLRFADGAISLTMERTRDGVSCRIEQEAGPTPFTVVLEPMVPSVVEAEVDGRPARLDVRAADGGVVAPVQLVLDDVRTVALRG